MTGTVAGTVIRLVSIVSVVAAITVCSVAYLVAGSANADDGAAVNRTAGSTVPASPDVKPHLPAGKTATVKSTPSVPAKPLWVELSPAQQHALTPLSAEWDGLDASHKKKWLTIGNKFSSLKPDQQLRVQNRMRDWAKLTPAQRRVARESYSRAKKLDSHEKSTKWQQYQQLPEDQRQKLAEDAAAKKRVANLPPASQSKGKLTSPPKNSSKTSAEQFAVQPTSNKSVPSSSHPQEVRSALPPSPQPAVK
jgi:hypothetical protein